MKRQSFLHKVYHLYYDGFRHMRLGRTLWLIIGIKLFIIFVVLRLFFFPNHIRTHAEEGKESDYVAEKLLTDQ